MGISALNKAYFNLYQLVSLTCTDIDKAPGATQNLKLMDTSFRKKVDLGLIATEHSVTPPPHPLPVGGIEPHTKFSKRAEGGLTESQFLEGAARKEGMNFFGEDCSFYIKKLKSETFNDKKSL